MTIAEWWRKRRSRKLAQPVAAKASKEAGITARVDMVRLEALAEAAYDAMYEAKLVGAKNRYEEAKLHFDRAIEAARAGPPAARSRAIDPPSQPGRQNLITANSAIAAGTDRTLLARVIRHE